LIRARCAGEVLNSPIRLRRDFQDALEFRVTISGTRRLF